MGKWLAAEKRPTTTRKWPAAPGKRPTVAGNRIQRRQ
jgi:hypothetical protein